MKPAAPRRQLNPFLLKAVLQSKESQDLLRRTAGWPNYPAYFVVIRSSTIIATDLTVARLEKLAELVSFPRDQIFFDEAPAMRADRLQAR